MFKNFQRLVLGFSLTVIVVVTAVYCTNKDDFLNGTIFSTDSEILADQISNSNSTLARIKQKGVLVALTRYNTGSYFIYKGQPMGYEYELLKLLADDLGVDLKIEVTEDWNGMYKALQDGEGDIIAANLTVTPARSETVLFTKPYRTTRQVLVQRKPDNWQKMTADEIEKQMLRNPGELVNQTVSVRASSSYYSRLNHIMEEVNGIINIDTIPEDVETEDLIKLVSQGSIELTIADEDIARLNQTYYPNIDVETVINDAQEIAWALRKDSPYFLSAVNAWLDGMRSTFDPTFNVIYKKYFKNSQAFARRMNSVYSSKNGDKISDYDELFKKNATRIGWDWRLLAAQAFEESQFNMKTESRMGAIGVMQLLPTTGKHFGATNLHNPAENIRAGASYLKWLNEYWSKEIPDPQERIKFILASYNAGQGHIQDARRLAEKYGYATDLWDGNVAIFLLKKSSKKYYTDPIVRFGYCRGIESCNYVKGVLQRYDHYKMLT